MPSALYSRWDTPIEFKSSGGVLFAPTSLANNAGWKSDRYDLGTAAGPNRFIGRAKTKLAVAAAVGAILTIYLIGGDGTDADGDLTSGNGSLPAADRRRNLIPIATIVADAATVGPFVAPIPLFEFDDRYLQFAWYNEMGQALSSTATDHFMRIFPVPLENQ